MALFWIALGGAVRELLQGIRPYDIDFSTNAPVEEIVSLVCQDDQIKERIRIIKAGASDTYGSVKVSRNFSFRSGQSYVNTVYRVSFCTNVERAHDNDPTFLGSRGR